MKKIKLIFAALLAASALALTGCPEVHEDVEWGIVQPEYVVGDIAKDSTSSTPIDFTAWNNCKAAALSWSDVSPSVATVVFTYSSSSWGGGSGKAGFKFVDGVATGSATAEYGPSAVTATDNGDLTFDLTGSNIVLSGLTSGSSYTLTITSAAGEKPALTIAAN